MRVRSDFPQIVEAIEHQWIPMPDGKRLAARIWLPETAASRPVPAILEFIPYRKRDGMALRDSIMHPYFAGHDYAAVRVDLRGSGDSEGVLRDEYHRQEQEDGLAVIDWLARQPWCSGVVGMIGISWGGFNGLQIAARRPPALKAVISVGSTDDRYADDVHYMGGCLLSANFTWAQTFFSDLARPPDPAVTGEAWRDMWRERLENAHLFIDTWLRHQLRDDYWKHGSVCEDYGAIACPVLAVGGWADSYTDTVMRLLSGLTSPRKGLIGPWGHDYPHTALPGPQIGFLQECLRWFDHWLKDEANGVMADPDLRVFIQEDVSADPAHAMRSGRWIGIERWPPAGQPEHFLHFGAAGLSPGAMENLALTHCSPMTLGAAAGEWCAYGQCSDQPADQRQDDGDALTFDTLPLATSLTILGAPVLEVELAADRPHAFICARLEDVAPSGASTRVTYGLLNLAHDEDHERVVLLAPGRKIRARIKLRDTAYAFLPGHRLRLALSTAYWPTVWPSPEPVTITVATGSCRLRLPLLDADMVTPQAVTFAQPEGAKPQERLVLKPGEMQRSLTRDYITGREEMRVVVDDGLQDIVEHNLRIGRRCEERYSIAPDDPLSARIEAHWTLSVARDEWRTLCTTRTAMTATAEEFRLEARLEAYEGEELMFSRDYDRRVPRQGI